jgi:endonuclease/exonuclease/phosphatase family metal-dependent hydrolase
MSDDLGLTSLNPAAAVTTPDRPCLVRRQPTFEATTVEPGLARRQALCHAAAMPSLRVGTWNIAGARREQTNQVDLDAVAAGVRALGVDLLAVQEVDRMLARSGRADQPAVIAQALGVDWFWSYAPALVGDDFRPLSGPDPGGPAYGNLLVSRLPLTGVEHLRFPPAGGGEQRTALLATIQVGSRSVTVAATHLSNKQGHNVRQLRELQGLVGSRAAPRLLVGDLNIPRRCCYWPLGGAGRRPGGAGPGPTPPPPSSSTISCATTRPGWSGLGAPGWSPPRSATTVPWSSNSTSQPPDTGPTARSVGGCSTSDGSALDGSGLLTLGYAVDLVESRRIPLDRLDHQRDDQGTR